MQKETSSGFDIPKKLARAARRFKLTPREVQTLALLSNGETWKSAAQRLGVSMHTISFHARNILFKVQASNLFACFVKIFLQ